MVITGALVLADQWQVFPHWLAVLASIAFGGLVSTAVLEICSRTHGNLLHPWLFGLWYSVISPH